MAATKTKPAKARKPRKAKAEKPATFESVLGITAEEATKALGTLTSRERQVADLMATGATNKTIAEAMGISAKTLDIHRLSARKKLQAGTSVDVARMVFASKLETADV